MRISDWSSDVCSSDLYIKRLIGLPGDKVQMKDGALYINGAPVKRHRIEDFEQRDHYGNVISRTKQWEETLPNGVTYHTLDLYDFSREDNTGIFTVPPGHRSEEHPSELQSLMRISYA